MRWSCSKNRERTEIKKRKGKGKTKTPLTLSELRKNRNKKKKTPLTLSPSMRSIDKSIDVIHWWIQWQAAKLLLLSPSDHFVSSFSISPSTRCKVSSSACLILYSPSSKFKVSSQLHFWNFWSLWNIDSVSVLSVNSLQATNQHNPTINLTDFVAKCKQQM